MKSGEKFKYHKRIGKALRLGNIMKKRFTGWNEYGASKITLNGGEKDIRGRMR